MVLYKSEKEPLSIPLGINNKYVIDILVDIVCI